MTNREIKEKILRQHGTVIWFTGLPCSGKSTLANALSNKLSEMGFFCHVLDGDEVRKGINKDLGFSIADRLENIRRVAEICKILTDNGIITLCSFVSPTEEIRNTAKNIIGSNDFLEIYVSTSVEICEKRDVSGLFKKSRKGEITDFTGISSPFEVPRHPDRVIDTSRNTLAESIELLLPVVQKRIQLIPEV